MKNGHVDRAAAKTWTRTLDPGPEKPLTSKNLDAKNNLGTEKLAPWKTRTLKYLDPEKRESWQTWDKFGIKKYVWL